MNRIYVIGDEFGYWANASWFSGLDWSSVAGKNPYYSYGYSLLLSPLFILKNPEVMYKAAVLLNAIFLCLTFLLLYSSLTMIADKISVNVKAIICLAITLYSNNIFSAATTQCETLLLTMYTLVFWFVCKYAYVKKEKYLFYALMAAGYMFSVHMRSLGVLISIAICGMVAVCVKRKWCKVMIIIGITVGCIVIYNYFKGVIIDNVYVNNAITKVNDYSEQFSRATVFFSLDGIIRFVKSILGKIFYLGISSFFMFYWCLVLLIRKVYELIQLVRLKEKIPEEYILWFFLLLSIGATMCITSVSVLDPYRVDAVFYGRYNELLMMPIILLGIVECYKCKSRNTVFVSMVVIQGILAIFTYNIVRDSGATVAYGNNMSVLASMSMNNAGQYVYDYFTVVAFLKATVIAGIINILFYCNSKSGINLIIAMLVLLLAWGHYGVQWTEEMVVKFQSDTRNNELADAIRKVCEKNNLNEIRGYTYRETDGFAWIRYDFMQYLLPEYKVILKEIDGIEDIKRGEIFLVGRTSNIWELLRGKCDILETGQDFYLVNIPE